MSYVQVLRGVTIATSLVIALTGPVNAAESAKSGTPILADLGSIDFQNSGSAEAQTAFLNGVKAFYSFEFDEAGDDFRLAQKIDPDFALAYWGEALSVNHPLWARQDTEAARATLSRFAATPAARAEKTPAGRERGLMEAVDVMYGTGDKLSRDIAYAEAMRRLHESYPEDNEVATLYALSLLGTVRPGDTGFRRQMQAAALSMAVFDRNPNHPGAAHFIIHALDDPEHAILALPAARVYAGIAPDAPHALHMPSHIFVQLGLWEDVVSSNTASYAAAVDLAERKGLERGGSDFHSLSWLQYGDLQLGHFDAAKRSLDLAWQTEAEHPTAKVHNGAMMMLARYVLETEKWSEMPFDQITERDNTNAGLHFVAGLAATHLGDLAVAKEALNKLTAIRERQEAKPATAYMAKIVAVGENELEAALALSAGDLALAEQKLRDAVAIESTLNAPSGPPLPMKPSFEMYGEFLLAQGRYEEAEVQFGKALERTPNRTKSVTGLAVARSKGGTSKSSDTAALR